MPRAHRETRSAVLAVAAGAVLGAAGLLPLGCRERAEGPFVEREQRRAPATPAEVATWSGQLAKRGARWFAFPDPPGEGPVETATFALGHEAHRLEVRRRGHRVTMGIRGVDPQVGGGGWLAFAEGVSEGFATANAGRPLDVSIARVSWSCLGTKLMSGNEGVARLVFSREGGLHVTYLAYGELDVWMKSYGRLVSAADAPLGEGVLASQIPAGPLVPSLAPEAVYRARVAVRVFGGGAVAGALVQLKGVPSTRVLTDEDGRAEVAFRGRDAARAQVLCAGAPGFRNAETVVFADDAQPGWVAGGLAHGAVTIELERLDLTDHGARYRWRHPAPDADPDDLMACGACHKWHYDQWQGSRHARSADNGHVAYEHARKTAAFPEAPDDCRGCHQPGAAAEGVTSGWEPRSLRASNHCDFCHKVHHVKDLRESGVFGALGLVRPDPRSTARPGGIHHVFGPSADVTNAFMGASWNPLFSSSHLCAACHQGGGLWREGAVPKLDTFEEWRVWAAREAAQGAERGEAVRARSCQDCHMPVGVTVSNEGKPVDQFAWDCLHRTPAEVHEHRFEGSGAAFAAAALDVRVAKRREGERWVAEVSVTNVGAGHRIPTGTWTKHVLVGVWARAGSTWLRQVEGDRAVTVSGPSPAEALAAGDWRNPGGFVLGVRDAAEASGALRQPDLWLAWKEGEVVDERLLPGATRTARCVFEAPPGGGEPTVVVRIVHRRGELGAGPAHTPWKPALYDEPPEVLWTEVVR